jgi:ubiquitin C-terminal hydrolase
VSHVWETRYRLLLEQLEELADQLRSEQPITPTALEEWTVRLLTGVIMLLWQHRVNKRGQCQYCRWTRWTWRFWHRRPQCTVYRSLDFAMRQNLDMVWRQLSGGP